MEKELLFFIITSVTLIIGICIDSWQDKEVNDEIRKFRRLITENLVPDGNNSWKFWGNANKLYDITVIDLILIIVTGWWWALLWLPIHWLLWWTVHDLTTGWFILKKPLHISSDPISQFFGEMAQQSGVLMLGWRLWWLFLGTMGYLTLSFNIILWN